MKRTIGPTEERTLVEGDNFYWRDAKAWEAAKTLPQNLLVRCDALPPTIAPNTKQALSWLKENTSKRLRELGWTITEVRAQCDKVKSENPENKHAPVAIYLQYLWWIEACHPDIHDVKERSNHFQKV